VETGRGRILAGGGRARVSVAAARGVEERPPVARARRLAGLLEEGADLLVVL
jgi:hypothetical protein